ncbi:MULTISPECIES: PL29 family lyase N-terminal domain-containing protein [Bacteroides]|uniref:PL29 family lyase N-terminal domain-containing protein n=1 Tax=Bacteroides TaxID=816 RepID=UPI0018980CD5|nr:MULTISPECIES: PL29 family lyase N-terminal domain-containing protein [Bacteroides]
MRRNQFLCSMEKCTFFLMAVCVVMFSSCYNDDDLKNSISGLEDRMAKLEASLQSIQSDISTLKTLTDALSQKKSIASVLENEDGSYTIKFSDQTEVTIHNGENGEDAPQITVIKDEEDGIYYWGMTGTDGKKTFLKDGEGNKMPVTAVAPKVRINTNTKEWEISTDNGKTWEPTGVYASGEGTGDTSLFSGVSQDDDYAYFTLKDGTILKVVKSKELKCEILSGKQYFANGEEKQLPVEMSGISKYTVTKPDGWKVSLTGKGLTIIAPVAENQYAEAGGKVAIVAVASNGQSLISEIPVILGEAPVAISVGGQSVSTTLKSGIEMYYLGVMEINEYSTEMVAELVNGYSARMYMKTAALDKVPLSELLGKDTEAGKTYMIWAVPSSETGEKYQPDDVIATAIKTAATVELKASDITFEGATVSATKKGCDSYYTGIADKANFSPERVIEDLAYGGGTRQYSDYNGPLEGKTLDFLPTIIPGTTYVLWAIPYNEEGEYQTEELVTVEIPVPALTYDGTATVNVGNVVATVTSVSAPITPGTDCYKYYYSYMKEQALANYATDREVISYLIKNGKSSKEAENFESASLEPGTKGVIVAVALDKKGQLGSLVKVQADSKEISYNASISVDVSIDPGALSTTLTLTPTGTPVKYRYVHMKLNDFRSYPYWGDEEAVKQALIMNNEVTEITVADLKENRLVIDDIEFNADYLLFMIAVDADGNPSATMTKKEYTSAKPTYVRIGRDADLWKASEPEVTIDKIEKDKFYTVWYTVKPKADCKQFYVFAGPEDYLTGMFDEQIKYVMKNGVKQTTTYSGNIYGTLPTNINVTWVDAEGRIYELSKTVVNVPE